MALRRDDLPTFREPTAQTLPRGPASSRTWSCRSRTPDPHAALTRCTPANRRSAPAPARARDCAQACTSSEDRDGVGSRSSLVTTSTARGTLAGAPCFQSLRWASSAAATRRATARGNEPSKSEASARSSTTDLAPAGDEVEVREQALGIGAVDAAVVAQRVATRAHQHLALSLVLRRRCGRLFPPW
jgi:hypothetical protein